MSGRRAALAAAPVVLAACASAPTTVPIRAVPASATASTALTFDGDRSHLPALAASRGFSRYQAAPTVAAASAGGQDLGTFWATCYDDQGSTATGHPAGPGEVAVDPAVIPLGTHLHVDGYGDAYAWDTGGAVRGRHIDEWHAGCAGWPNPTVHVWRIP